VGHFRDDDKPVAHNTFLSILAENGLIGFSIFLTFYGLLIVCIMKMPADLRKLWFVMISVWTIGVLTLTWEHRKPTWLLFALILAQASTSIPRKAGRVGRRRSSPAFQPTFASRTAAPTYFPHDANRPHYQQP
jgi:O-antigen ligase